MTLPATDDPRTRRSLRRRPSPARQHHAAHDAVVVVLCDDTLPEALAELRGRLRGMLEPGPSRLVLDLSRVSRLSSTSIATLLWVKRTCGARAVEVVVRRPSRGSIGVLRRTELLARRGREPQTWEDGPVGADTVRELHARRRP